MTLSDLVKKYLKENNISQRQFAKKCGMSCGYICMIVNGINPRTKSPIIPTLKSLNEIARGMNMTIDDLFEQVDDMYVGLDICKNKKESTKNHARVKDEKSLEFATLFQQLTEDQQKMLVAQMKGLLLERDKEE